MSATTKPDANTTNAKSEHPIHGARNLFILGVVAISLAVISTAISLYIYHATGDIYLDRSRPGYLPDEEEVTQDSASTPTYTYPDNGPLDPDELDDYLDALRQTIDRLEDYSDPYAPEPLSDQSLGIPSADATNISPDA